VNSADAQDGGDVAGLTGEARPLLSDPDEVQKIKTSYKSLLSRIESKQRSVQDREKWCQATMRDSKMDGVMVTQNLKRMNAKLNLVKVAMLQYEKSSQYYVDQGKLMQSQVQKLSDLAKEEEHEYSKSYKTLSDFSKQLMSLATELTQVLTTEERRNADMVKSLVQKLENHQNMLEVQHRMWGKWRDELVQADSAIQAALQTNIQHNDRRVMQFKTETQFLTSLSHAKQNDKALSAGYQQISRQMCSKDIVAGMKTEIDTLQKQATELQNSFTQNVAPFA
jgi:chromosome segregation ATPase